MNDKKTKAGTQERTALMTDFSQDISYSMWRRGAGPRAGEVLRPMGGLLR